ncbi:hypothetical protein Cpir12675_006401 [Ceratocystis pirilliformis]|uniref:Uncharacterized protein n=1 Tax=Ceratocystis pirilliformis TaxID=259994 RepID=A0ABR3YHN3_9PEZI
MSTNYRIRKPYVLASLPRPFNPETGKFFVGEVFGHQLDQPRKKRTELIAAIDGESVNLYDITSSSLITSHPISPEQSFSCAPISLRMRLAKLHGTVRYTYAATRAATNAKGKPKQRITVFKDSVDANGKATSESLFVTVPSASPIILLETSTVLASVPNSRFDGNLVAVCKNGHILCFSPEDLTLRWQQSGNSLSQDEVTKFSALSIEHAAVVPAGDVIDGLFEGNSDIVSSAFSRAVTKDQKARADVVIFVACVTRGDVSERLLCALAVNPTATDADATVPALVRLHLASLPDPEKLPASADRQFRLHVPSGSLTMLSGDYIYVYDVSRALPQIAAAMYREAATSILRLTNHSIIATSATDAAVCNPSFGSVQALMSLDMATLKKPLKGEIQRFDMLANFKKLDLVVGLVGSLLVALPVEQPHFSAKKRQAEGLLIDSIGRGGPRDPLKKRARAEEETADIFTAPLPGTMTAEYMAEMRGAMDSADKALASGDIAAFDNLLAPCFGLTVSDDGSWDLECKKKQTYPLVDRRWVLYALSRAFALDEPSVENAANGEEERLPELRVALPTSNLIMYLTMAGHFTLRNLRAAFRESLENVDVPDAHLARGSVLRLVELDPGMDLLHSYLVSNKLAAVELLTVILVILRSLGFIPEEPNITKSLQGNSSSSEATTPATKATAAHSKSPDTNIDISMELDQLERELQTTEFYLSDETSIRARALTVAFAKLAAQSAPATVTALRATLQPHEVLSLIYVLRGELVRGSWTTRYQGQSDTICVSDNDQETGGVDAGPNADVDANAAPDGSITLIADLLSRCIDAVGMLGWMVHDSLSVAALSPSPNQTLELGDFLSALKLEVSAALQGLEECVVLEGLVGGAVRHARGIARAAKIEEKRAVERGGLRKASSAVKVGNGAVGEAAMLPLGSSWADIEPGWKVGKGGEIMQRTHRELEHLLSKGTRTYSLEKLLF